MLIQQGLNDDDPLVRQGALNALENVTVEQRILGFPLVWDDVRSVRVQAANLMAGYPQNDRISAAQQEKLQEVIAEYIETQKFNAERPEAQLNLGGIYTDLGQFVKAEQAYRKALQLQPLFVPAYVNFAQMLSGQGKETQAENLLKAGVKKIPSSADIYHALGLSQVRQKNLDAAIQSLAKAAQLNENNRRYQYVYAVALQSVGKLEQAIDVLVAVHDRNPTDADILSALVTFNREAGKSVVALAYAKKLQALFPGNQQIEKLILDLEAG